MLSTLKEIFERDLNKVKKEIDLYDNEELLWVVQSEVNNSGGNLVLHICGNLKHFIGATLGNTGFKRDRDAEFSNKNVPLEQLHHQVDTTIKVILETLDNMNELELEATYPINVLREDMTTEFFLTHLATHLSYHLGQLTYHRLLIS